MDYDDDGINIRRGVNATHLPLIVILISTPLAAVARQHSDVTTWSWVTWMHDVAGFLLVVLAMPKPPIIYGTTITLMLVSALGVSLALAEGIDLGFACMGAPFPAPHW